jgi:hypothetical protein
VNGRAARLLLVTFRSRIRATILALSAAALVSCEGDAAHPTAPKGTSAFGNFVVIGTGLSMGVQSGGVLYESQVESWPALLARSAGANFRQPLLRAPGCQPPRIAPLQLSVYLSGVSITGIDSSCAGALDTLTPPVNNLAIAGATAYMALFLTPKIVLNAVVPYPAGDRARYPLVLGSTQSQVTAMRIESPSFVAIELGLMETLPAATSGLDVPATSYTQATPFTNVPSGLFAPVFSAIADSVKLTGARVVVFIPPHMGYLYGLRPASDIWADRAELATFGVAVAADCSTSTNFVFTPSVIPQLAASAASTGSAKTLSCTDLAGGADGIVSTADIARFDQFTVNAEALIGGIAKANGWALVDLDDVFIAMGRDRVPYSAATELACVYPYGRYVSLDGVFPNVTGQQLIANAAAAAINSQYGFSLPVPAALPIGVLAAKLCP